MRDTCPARTEEAKAAAEAKKPICPGCHTCMYSPMLILSNAHRWLQHSRHKLIWISTCGVPALNGWSRQSPCLCLHVDIRRHYEEIHLLQWDPSDLTIMRIYSRHHLSCLSPYSLPLNSSFSSFLVISPNSSHDSYSYIAHLFFEMVVISRFLVTWSISFGNIPEPQKITNIIPVFFAWPIPSIV